MVKWEGIEDNGPIPTRVWLSRTKLDDENEVNDEEWKPLRKVDCKTLNDQRSKSMEYGAHPVLIEKGRATADPDFGIVRANFVPRPLRELSSSTWFMIADEKKDPQTGKTRPVLEPMPDEESEKVEELYQRAIYASSSFGDGIEPLLKEKVDLGGNNKYHIAVCKEGGHYVMKKLPNGWFSKSYPLQRGYGSYVSAGEDEEEMLGPIDHVVFVVHGIGEAWFSKDKTTSMVEQMDQFRLSFQKRQIADWKKKCTVAKKKKEPAPDPPNRVEFLPILWYDRVHDSSNAMTKSLMSVTLNTIPALRSIANDVVLDVLLYLTPNYCFDVLESVTDQIFSVYGVFNKTFPDFATRGGKCSLIGHSLGSVICWDLLSLKKNAIQTCDNEHGVQIMASKTASNAANINYQQKSNSNEVEAVCMDTDNENGGGAWGPSLPRKLENVIPFEPDFTMFVGSPIGLFLSLRGAHAVFDSIRDLHPEKPRISPFTLPAKAIYNIFSPSDPVAYRIEPLLLPHGTKDVPDPLYLTRLGEGVRLHVKAMQIGDGIRKSTWSLFSAKAAAAATASDGENKKGSDKTNTKEKDDRSSPKSNDEEGSMSFPLGGRTSRLDYQLQPGVIESEYISAVTAHSTYFFNTDIIDFVIDVTGKKDDEVIDLTMSDDSENNN